ncbi:MAG: hypothetical protein Q7N50_14230 [Armatimonadota bacterium]|nr:hypothetical protein [Armatimonadota bacterium]
MTTVAGWITAISVLVIAVALTFGITAAVLMIRGYVNRLLNAVDPAMKRAEAALEKVNGIAETVRTRTEEIAHTVEDTVEDVSGKVKSTTSMLEDAVRPPLVNVASVLAGVSKGLQVWSELSKEKGGDGRGK